MTPWNAGEACDQAMRDRTWAVALVFAVLVLVAAAMLVTAWVL